MVTGHKLIQHDYFVTGMAADHTSFFFEEEAGDLRLLALLDDEFIFLLRLFRIPNKSAFSVLDLALFDSFGLYLLKHCLPSMQLYIFLEEGV